MKHPRKRVNDDFVNDLLVSRDPTFRKVYHKDNQDVSIQSISDDLINAEEEKWRYCIECGGRLFYFSYDEHYSCNSCGASFNHKNRDLVPEDLLLKKPKQEIAPPNSQTNVLDEDKVFISYTQKITCTTIINPMRSLAPSKAVGFNTSESSVGLRYLIIIQGIA
jgi:hypothetical protein